MIDSLEASANTDRLHLHGAAAHYIRAQSCFKGLTLQILFEGIVSRLLHILRFTFCTFLCHLWKCDTSPYYNELEMEAVFHIIPKSVQLSHPIMQICCSLKRIRSPNHMLELCKRYNNLLCMHCTRLMVIRY